MAQKWEYKRFVKSWRGSGPLGDDEVEWLNELGAEGWEVVELAGKMLDDHRVALCKRPLVSACEASAHSIAGVSVPALLDALR